MKPRILYLCDSLGLGGTEKWLVDIISHLDFNRVEVTICTLRDENAFLYLTDQLPVRIISLKLHRAVPRSVADAWRLRKLLTVIRECHPDVLHTQGSNADLYGQIFGRLLGVSTIISTLHILDSYRTQTLRTSLPYRFRLIVEDIAIRSCSTVIVVSEELQRYALTVRHVPARRILLLHNAVRPLIRSASRSDRKLELFGDANCRVIGFVGRLAEQKNLFTLLESFSLVRLGIKNVRLVIVGDGTLRPLLSEYCATIGISDAVDFTGAIENVQPYYEALDVFVLASFSEGLPLALLEAMTMAIPVVVPAVGGIPELISSGTNGILVHPAEMKYYLPKISESQGADSVDKQQAGELADAMQFLLDDAAVATTIGEAGKRAVLTTRSLSTNANVLMQLYARKN